MKNVDRRKWLKTIGLAGGFALTGGLEALAFESSQQQKITSLIKLSSNENPYGPSKRVREAILNNFDNACRYPFGMLRELVEMIAEKEGVSKDHIVVTGGSTEDDKAVVFSDEAYYDFITGTMITLLWWNCIAKTSEAKAIIYDTLNGLGLEHVKSHTNFVFFKTGRHIDSLIKDMQKENVLIGRPFPPFYDWARISTGKIEEVEHFGKALKKVLG
ncbi:Histidinol-phosphate aminotransferase [Nymphon striatum]|nr:Histidinol-phosphate aminotransferase [Nymphon striatum]